MYTGFYKIGVSLLGRCFVTVVKYRFNPAD